MEGMAAMVTGRPEWLKVRAPGGENYREVKALVASERLHTICESAHCPNMGECWEQRTATFMILGNVCTRRCGFCAVAKGAPLPLDWDEARRVGEAVARLGLEYAVVTSVDRDDRKDGGAALFVRTIEEIRRRQPGCKIEVLIPDFQGKLPALRAVLEAAPDVLNHNIETVRRLYRRVRPGSRYDRSLALLDVSKELAPDISTKSGMMVGIGEEADEVVEAMRDLRQARVDILTIGQYLRPSLKHLPITRYYTPEEFARFRQLGRQMGFRHVESGPFVRSSYHARNALDGDK
jgi:lipoic acid synthetase